jgi:hypothetical protein
LKAAVGQKRGRNKKEEGKRDLFPEFIFGKRII